jgi:hypothetical protein
MSKVKNKSFSPYKLPKKGALTTADLYYCIKYDQLLIILNLSAAAGSRWIMSIQGHNWDKISIVERQ